MCGNSFSVDGCYMGCELGQEFSTDFDREVTRNTAGFLALLKSFIHNMFSEVVVGAGLMGKVSLDMVRERLNVQWGYILG